MRRKQVHEGDKELGCLGGSIWPKIKESTMGVMLYKYTFSHGKEKRVVLVTRKKNCPKFGACGAILGHSCVEREK